MIVRVLALLIVQHEQSATGKNATCEKCNSRRMQNENIATCKSATWNSTIHKMSASRKKYNMRRLLHKKVQHENGSVNFEHRLKSK